MWSLSNAFTDAFKSSIRCRSSKRPQSWASFSPSCLPDCVTHVVPHNLRPCDFAQHMAEMSGAEAPKIPFIAPIGRVRISAKAVC